MHLIVKPSTGVTVSFEVEPKDTILSVKQKIYEKVNLPPENQSLVFEGKLLEDGQTVADCNLKNDSIIHMILRAKGEADHLGEPLDKDHHTGAGHLLPRIELQGGDSVQERHVSKTTETLGGSQNSCRQQHESEHHPLATSDDLSQQL